MVRPQMMMGNMMRGNSTPPGPRPTFPNPIQRPGLGLASGGMSGGPAGPMASSQPPRNVGFPSNTMGGGGVSSSRPQSMPQSSSVKAQQAKARQDLLAHAASFLNPTNKPSTLKTATTAAPAPPAAPPTAPKTDGSGDGKTSPVAASSVAKPLPLASLTVAASTPSATTGGSTPTLSSSGQESLAPNTN